MRVLTILAVSIAPAIAQHPLVQLTNVTRTAGKDFQIGDKFEIVVSGAPNQPVSVRTTVKGRTDWSPVIGRTDFNGRWSTAGQFDNADLGGWSEAWTVGGKLAEPTLRFSVSAPCLKGGQGSAAGSGPNWVLTCDTADGRRTFATRSDSDPFRTPDGRVIPGRTPSELTREQYRMEIVEHLLGSGESEMRSGLLGDESGELLTAMIGPNALSEEESRNALVIIRNAFENPERIPQAAKNPSRTLLFLRNLADSTDQEPLKKQIAETIAWLQAQ